MPTISLTAQQQAAVKTTGGSVIVSAAAGSGKTAVLAERCAYLVCDARPGERCGVDELLVLTFTDAAAAEMRVRIIESIRARVGERPRDGRLREQLALTDAAQISTIHSFCHWIIRRWFNELGISPAAALLDENEAALLKREVLDGIFSDLYATRGSPENPLGVATVSPPTGLAGDTHKEAPPPREPPADTGGSPGRLARGFTRLVDVYGLDDDRNIAALVLRLSEYVTSLPDSAGWLHAASAALTDDPGSILMARAGGLATELRWQAEHCAAIAAVLEAGEPVGRIHGAQIGAYAQQLGSWSAALSATGSEADDRRQAAATDVSDEQETQRMLANFEAVRQHIYDFEFARARAPRLPKDSDPAVVLARDAARDTLKKVAERLFDKRLRKRFAMFSVDQAIEGLSKTAPYVSTIAGLVNSFRAEYRARKRRLDVLDFSDLEQLAFALLRSDDDPQRPSDVACSLHRRFAYVLVDEFQDINPIQQSIIHLVSREADPDLPDNLFAVGDVKQSIYRFRLAEPTIFTDRVHRFRESDTSGKFIALQSNFRSRPKILETVNLVFRGLMREGGDIVYDSEAELVAGRTREPDDADLPVELHLLERRWNDRGGDDEALERIVPDLSDPALWSPIEREAFLIGLRIADLMKSGSLKPDGQALAHRDIAVLFRATKVNAERAAAMLTAMGIPAYANVGGSLFGALEVREVLAALQVLDNFQQDIPLAAVLRSGILGEVLSEDDLVEVRCLDRDIPFHECVRRYETHGAAPDVHGRLSTILGRINRLRNAVRRRPLAEVLWTLYEQHGYLAYVGGRPNGAQRRANLLKLHDVARRFGSFKRQSLHRFLSFVQALEDENRDIGSAPSIGEAEDVVRIMSIHQSKGLEFPVVFVAGLGTKFNLGDRVGRMIFERDATIGLRIIDGERMLEYPSAAHAQVADQVERNARQEELRVLYVAMTRARDKLVLVGSSAHIDQLRETARIEGTEASSLTIATALTPLDWLIPALGTAPRGAVDGLGGTKTENPLVTVEFHDVAEMADWRPAGRANRREDPSRQAAAHCQPLPADEPLAPQDSQVEPVLARIDHVYPSLASASVRAVVAASEFKGAFDFTRQSDEQPDRQPGSARTFDLQHTPDADVHGKAAAQRGIVTHRVLQHLDFAVAVDPDGVASELQRLVADGLVDTDDLAAVDEAGIAWFVSTPLAAAIRQAGAAYRREFQYIATESPDYFDRSVVPAQGDQVLVRGIVDGILPAGEGIEIVDFKTDAIRSEEVPARAETYRPQMELYARGMSRLWRRPVRACWLVFTTPREIVEMEYPDASGGH